MLTAAATRRAAPHARHGVWLALFRVRGAVPSSADSSDERPASSLVPKRKAPPALALSPSAHGAATLLSVTGAGELEELVRRSQQGDPAAFAELFRKHRGDVGRLVFRLLGSSPDTEDVVQEVFLQVHRSLGEFRGQAKFTTWLHRVTVNVVLMVRRAARSRPVFSGELLADGAPDQRLLPDEDAARRQRIAAFRRLLDRLPEKKRTVFILHEIEGITPVDIGKIVDAPVLTVRTRLFYARKELAEMMREEPALTQLAEELVTSDHVGAKPIDTEAT